MTMISNKTFQAVIFTKKVYHLLFDPSNFQQNMVNCFSQAVFEKTLRLAKTYQELLHESILG